MITWDCYRVVLMMKLSGRLVMVRRVLHLGSVRISWQWYHAGNRIFAFNGNVLEMLVSCAHRTFYVLVGLTVGFYTDINLTIMTESILRSAVLFEASSGAICDLDQPSSHVRLFMFDKEVATTSLKRPRGSRLKVQRVADGERRKSSLGPECLFTLSVFKI